jgi:hypothetical protein
MKIVLGPRPTECDAEVVRWKYCRAGLSRGDARHAGANSNCKKNAHHSLLTRTAQSAQNAAHSFDTELMTVLVAAMLEVS